MVTTLRRKFLLFTKFIFSSGTMNCTTANPRHFPHLFVTIASISATSMDYDVNVGARHVLMDVKDWAAFKIPVE